MSWGTWVEDRRYLSEDGRALIIVSRREDHEGKIRWKTERRPLSRLDRLYYSEAHRA
jgi:hypothetical protein